jgi:hypothetical protein
MTEAQGDQFFQTASQIPSYQINGIVDVLAKASNCYKISGCWLKSAECFVKLAELQATNPYASMTNYAKAGEMYKNIDHTKAIKCYETAIELAIPSGKFSTAGKYMVCMGEIFELDNEWSKAMNAYTMAYTYHASEGSEMTGTACLSKAKNIGIKFEDYSTTVNLLEKMIVSYQTNPLTSFKSKELLVEMVMCKILLGQIDQYDQMMTKYADLPGFVNSALKNSLDQFVLDCQGSQEFNESVPLTDLFRSQFSEVLTSRIKEMLKK